MTPCPKCSVDIDVWGRLHICRPRVVTRSTDVANDVANGTSATYRYRDASKRRAYMRDLMQAEARLASAGGAS